jgi:limonene-1,2-epoxide hydrolase
MLIVASIDRVSWLTVAVASLQLAGDGEVADVGLERTSLIAVKVHEGDLVVDFLNLTHGDDDTRGILDDAENGAANRVDVLDGGCDDAAVLLERSVRKHVGELVGAAVDLDTTDSVGSADVVGEIDGEPVLRSSASEEGGDSEGAAGKEDAGDDGSLHFDGGLIVGDY